MMLRHSLFSSLYRYGYFPSSICEAKIQPSWSSFHTHGLAFRSITVLFPSGRGAKKHRNKISGTCLVRCSGLSSCIFIWSELFQHLNLFHWYVFFPFCVSECGVRKEIEILMKARSCISQYESDRTKISIGK